MNIIKSILYPSVFCILALASCDKELSVDKVDFSVNTDKMTYKVGDSVIFKFSGNPDNITFFSGETGSQYEFKDRLTAEGKPELSFTTFRQYGAQNIPLELLVSTTFNGKLDENIANGGWKDITTAATFSTGSADVPSGSIDLSPYIGDKPLYIAFHYKGDAGSTQRTWTVKEFQVKNKLTSGPILSIADLSTAGFSEISLKNPNAVWKIDANQLRIQGGNAAAEANDDWVVTQALYLDKVTPDKGSVVKNILTKATNYTHIYNTPGTYKVTFVASNATADQSASALKELTITVTP